MSFRRLLTEMDEKTPIDLSPMIDCIFILLIFFIVTTVFADERGMQVVKPDAAASMPMDENASVTLKITAEDKVLIDGRPVTLADLPRLVRRATRDPETSVVISAHHHASHGRFVSVWDAAKEGGAQKLSFSTDD